MSGEMPRQDGGRGRQNSMVVVTLVRDGFGEDVPDSLRRYLVEPPELGLV